MTWSVLWEVPKLPQLLLTLPATLTDTQTSPGGQSTLLLRISGLDIDCPSTALVLSYTVLPSRPNCNFYLHKTHRLLTGTRRLFMYFASSLCEIPILLQILITFFNHNLSRNHN